MSLEGSRIVIIGGSSGIGFATARLALEAGADVVIAGRSAARLKDARVRLGRELETGNVDVTIEDSVRSFFDAAGPFDHLTTPGNQGTAGPFLELETEAAQAGFNSKFWGQYRAAKYAVPHLRVGGSIVLVGGAWSQRPPRAAAARAAINSAVEGLARGLAVELGPSLRVNAVSPGVLDTPLYESLPEPERGVLFAAAASGLPLERIGIAEHAAKAILYLMDNDFVTGSTLFVDGGLTLR
ncbi:MAG: SDR family oxidoreductase [Actinobacteria bacterium]|nr:SDR family oxidoreductase [Actinomycetota bacterium]